MTQKRENLFQVFMWLGMVTLIALTIVLTIKKCNAQTTNQSSLGHPYGWDYLEEGFLPLDFNSIYYIDTANMVVYYDNYDQFDMDNEYEKNPSNINEDGNLVLHISKGNLVELMNRILQWISFDSYKEYDEKYYIEDMFGIGETDTGTYYITFLGN